MEGKNSKDKSVKKSVFSPWFYLFSFLLCSFVISCSFLLLFAGVTVPEELIMERAPMIFLNIFFLSLIFTIVDGIRRKYTVERPVKQILEMTGHIREGNFKKRIVSKHKESRKNEFDRIIDNLNIMAQELSGIETLRTDFVANVSHELKTPLALIQNCASLLQSPGLTEEQRRAYSQNIMDASKRLSSLITNILKLNKLENQQIFPQTVVYNLSGQICECLLGFEQAWEEKQIVLETDIMDDVMVEADPELLTLVWNNLFSNAFKFTGNGGTVTVRLSVNGEDVDVEVRDTGCGISPAMGRRIFEKFYQGDTSHAAQGNGLGLALVKRVVDIIGGEIAVESEVGKGSSFSVTLRRADGRKG